MSQNLGPLTTIFTPPASCSQSALWVSTGCAGSVSVIRGPLSTDGPCYPSSDNALPGAYYSPGLCPSGYSAACSSVGAQDAETVYTCCPDAGWGLTYQCSLGDEWTWGLCQAGQGGATATFTDIQAIHCGTTLGPKKSYFWDGVVQAQSVQVRFKEVDASLFRTTSAMTMTGEEASTTKEASKGAEGSSSDSESAIPISSPSSTAASRTESLAASSTAQKSGATQTGQASTGRGSSNALIAVGVTCGLLLAILAAAGGYLFRKSRSLARQLTKSQHELQVLSQQADPRPPNLPGHRPQWPPYSELMDRNTFELDGIVRQRLDTDIRPIPAAAFTDSPTVGKVSPVEGQNMSPDSPTVPSSSPATTRVNTEIYVSTTTAEPPWSECKPHYDHPQRWG